MTLDLVGYDLAYHVLPQHAMHGSKSMPARHYAMHARQYVMHGSMHGTMHPCHYPIHTRYSANILISCRELGSCAGWSISLIDAQAFVRKAFMS